MVKDFVQKVFEENGVNADIHDAAVTGSRSRGLENADSDIDVAIEVDSDLKEDALFNIIHDEEFKLSGYTIDINPIKADETGTLETYLPTAEAYLTEKAQNNKHTDNFHFCLNKFQFIIIYSKRNPFLLGSLIFLFIIFFVHYFFLSVHL